MRSGTNRIRGGLGALGNDLPSSLAPSDLEANRAMAQRELGIVVESFHRDYNVGAISLISSKTVRMQAWREAWHVGGAQFGWLYKRQMERAALVIEARGDASPRARTAIERMRGGYAHNASDPVSSPARMSFADADVLAREAPFGALADAVRVWTDEFGKHFGTFPTSMRPEGARTNDIQMNERGETFLRDSRSSLPPTINDLSDAWPEIRGWVQTAGIVAAGGLALFVLNMALPRS